MIAFAALIWVGAVIGMPAGYYVLTGIGAACSLISFVVKVMNGMNNN